MSGLTPARREALQQVADGAIEYVYSPGPEGWNYVKGWRKYRQVTMYWLRDNGYIAHETERRYFVERVVLTEKGWEAL